MHVAVEVVTVHVLDYLYCRGKIIFFVIFFIGLFFLVFLFF